MKKILIIFALIVSLFIPNVIEAKETIIIDEIDVLTDSQIERYEKLLAVTSEQYDIDLFVYFTNTETTKSIDLFAADKAEEYNCYDGLAFVVNMYSREYVIIANGEAQIYAGYLSWGEDLVYDNLSEGKFDRAVESFAYFAKNACKEYEEIFNNNSSSSSSYPNYSDNQNASQNEKPYTKNLMISIAFGFIIAIGYVRALKNQLKTEKMNRGAANYIKPNSFSLIRSGEIFLYTSKSRRLIPKNDDHDSSSGHGGGSYHSSSSSSGHSYSTTGGRKF